MMPSHVERISGPGDPRLAEYRNVTDPELIRVRGLFVAEGRLVVRRLIEDGRYRIQSLFLSDAARHSLEPLLATLAATTPVYLGDAGDFTSITGYNVHRGCLALAFRSAEPPVDDLLASIATAVVLEGITDADNVGGVFRNAAAFGADAVLLSPTCCDPLYRKAIRTSMAATLRVPFSRIDDWPAALTRIRARGFTLVALTPREPAEDLDAFAGRLRPAKLALIVGTEGAGLTPEIEATADYRVRIPVRADVDSLNLAVATGIALYTINGRR